MVAPSVNIEIFSDVIDALEKVVNALATAKNIPKKTRAVYRDAVRETFTLLDTALTLVYNRLGDLINIAANDPREDFIKELHSLNNPKDWYQVERDVRLCSNLRVTHHEMDGLTLKLMVNFSGRDWDNTRKLVDQILEREGNLADYIGGALQILAKQAETADKSDRDFHRAVRSVERNRIVVGQERERLIRAEVNFLNTF